MARFHQYEVWEYSRDRWQMVAAFQDFEVARALASRRNTRVRLMHVTYEDGKPVQQEVLAEIGATREEP